MGSLETTRLILLLMAVATVAGLSGFVVSSRVHRKKRRAPVHFSIGFVFGLLAGAILRRRWHGLHAVGAVACTMVDQRLTFAASRLRLLPMPRRPRI